MGAAFKQSAPSELTGNEDTALDKDRSKKYHKSEGKGEARTSGGAGSGSKGQGQPVRPHQRQPTHQHGRWGGGGWHDKDWKKDESEELRMLKQLMQQIAKLVLRHEDSVNLWRAESSYVLFIRTDIPGSLVPSLFAAKSEWQALKESNPEKVRRPMRNILFSCLVREMHDRLVKIKDDAAKREAMEKLGWLKGDQFQRMKWDAQQKKHVHDDEGTSIDYGDVLAILQALMTRSNTVEALLRFHPTRPLVENMQGSTVAFLLQFSLQNDAGMQMYADMAQLCHCGSTFVAGLEVRRERSSRSQLANQISKLLSWS